jgi:hypothetical protein
VAFASSSSRESLTREDLASSGQQWVGAAWAVLAVPEIPTNGLAGLRGIILAVRI